MTGAYYNEVDPHAAQWLRNLIAAGHIAAGDVDERSIVDVRADDLRGYTQCHFFAGIGVWSYALRCAGWPDDRPVWTGSCPCQPFSSAGKGLGHEDERHLWPTWFGLIGESRPHVVFGEQVANGDGYAWLDVVGHDLEVLDYAIGALCPAACGVGAPHIRQRLYFVADTGLSSGSAEQREEPRGELGRCEGTDQGAGTGQCGRFDELAHPNSSGFGAWGEGFAAMGHWAPTEPDCRSLGVALGDTEQQGLEISQRSEVEVGTVAERERCSAGVPNQHGGMGNPEWFRWREVLTKREPEGRIAVRGPGTVSPGPVNGFWGGADWIWCRDPSGPRWRPVESGTFPLAHGVTSRLVKLRAYGNAIVAPVAEEFIRAYMLERGI